MKTTQMGTGKSSLYRVCYSRRVLRAAQRGRLPVCPWSEAVGIEKLEVAY